MIDVHKIVLDYLETVAAVTALAGSRIYAGRDVPPHNYAITDGSAVVFRVRGGNEDYEGALLTPSIQVKCYGATEQAADALYRAVDDALTGKGMTVKILHGERETQGQPLEEPDTLWRYTLAFYTLMLRTN